ncbi:MAG: pyridoxamine 5'-phosphate oxidase family protein [Chloroflexi bacterium]|nr:pyridoxamine 5'-phosphate oxidase family protein [Chloroflexota bacterium]
MANLTPEMKAMVASQLAVVATASKGGIPNVGPKGSVLVIDDQTLAYSESTGDKTLKNLKENPNVAVLVVDRQKSDGFQIKGKAELLTSGDLFEKVAKRQEERGRPRPRLVARIGVDEIYPVKSGATPRKIA